MPATFLYFVETEKNELGAEDLNRWGWGTSRTRASRWCGARQGPGRQGRAVFAVGAGAKPTFKPAEQTWARCAAPAAAGRRRGWASGTTTDPAPDDLKKKRFVGGELIELADGSRWAVPVCHSVVRGSTLPKRMVLGDDGRTWELRELPEFLALCARAEKVWEAFVNQTAGEDGRSTIELDHQTAADVAVEALGVNYRVGAAEVSMLGTAGHRHAVRGDDGRRRRLHGPTGGSGLRKKKRHPRYLTYRRWRDGLLGDYLPTFADLTWYLDEQAGGEGAAILSRLLDSLGVRRLVMQTLTSLPP
jgi:hypothetical protein